MRACSCIVASFIPHSRSTAGQEPLMMDGILPVESGEAEPLRCVSVWFGQAGSVKMRVRHVIMTNDCFGRNVRLTDERLAHILERTEMRGMREEIAFN